MADDGASRGLHPYLWGGVLVFLGLFALWLLIA